jgi:acyl-CoA reductase-like NAD-dependent aldehyde dehydrogenase
MSITDHDSTTLDRAVADLRQHASSWTSTPLPVRISLLEQMLPRIVQNADQLVAPAAAAKGYPVESPWTAEDWIAGPWALAQNTSALLHVLRRSPPARSPSRPGL